MAKITLEQLKDWKPESMMISDMEKWNNTHVVGGRGFQIELETTREERLRFMDELTGGMVSYVSGVAEKFIADYDSLPKKQNGRLAKRAVENWLKENDPKKAFVPSRFDSSEYEYRYHTVERTLDRRFFKGDFNCRLPLADEMFNAYLSHLHGEEYLYWKHHGENVDSNELAEHFLERYEYGTLFQIIANTIGLHFFGDEDKRGDMSVYAAPNNKPHSSEFNHRMTAEEMKMFEGLTEETIHFIQSLAERPELKELLRKTAEAQEAGEGAKNEKAD